MREQADVIIINTAQVATCAGSEAKRDAALRDIGLIADGGVAVRGGEIVAVGMSAEIEAHFDAPEIFDAAGMLVCPGFIDCHTHTVWGGDRLAEFEQRIAGAAYLDILAAGGGILSTMRATRTAGVDKLAADAAARLKIMAALGTTTTEIKTGYGLSLESELASLEAIARLADLPYCEVVPTFLGAHAIPPEFQGDDEGYTRHVIEVMLPAVAAWLATSPFVVGAPLSVDVFCERNAFTLEQSWRILTAAKGFGLAVRAHVDEFTDLGGVRMACELGALSVDHLDVTGADGVAALAASDTVGVIMPAVNFNLGSTHFADARGLIDAGAIVALATDLNPGSAPCYSLPLVMAMACRYQKMLPAEALNAVTLNAAHALGIAGRVGSLEVGKQADLLVCNVDDYRALAYDIGVNHVSAVMKRGAWVM